MNWKLVKNPKGRYFRIEKGDTELYITTKDGFDPLREDGFYHNPINLHQIHSDRIYIVNKYFPRSGVDGDGLITFEPGIYIAIKTADCYPIFVFDEDSKVASVVHAGWRGTAKRILKKAVRMIKDLAGIEAGKLIVAFGPGISGESYEIGEDVARFFDVGVIRKDGKIFLDLVKENVKQAEDCGINRIILPPGDTYLEENLFYSYRRENGNNGLMWSIIGLGGHHGKNH